MILIWLDLTAWPVKKEITRNEIILIAHKLLSNYYQILTDILINCNFFKQNKLFAHSFIGKMINLILKYFDDI